MKEIIDLVKPDRPGPTPYDRPLWDKQLHGIQPGPGEPALWLAPPHNLHFVTDPRDCAAHLPLAAAFFGGALACQEMLARGEVMLAWDWPAPRPAGEAVKDVGRPTGYQIYATIGSAAPIHYDSQDAGWDWTTRGFAPLPRDEVCFTVRAHRQPLLSSQSNVVCMHDKPPALKRVILKPSAMQTFHSSDVSDTGVFRYDPQIQPREIAVGWQDYYDHWLIGANDWYWDAYSPGIRFELEPYRDNVVYRATLRYRTRPREIAGPDDCAATLTCIPADRQCGSAIHYAFEDWANGAVVANTLPRPGDLITAMPEDVDGRIDLTVPAIRWLQNRVNLGVVIDSDQMGYSEYNERCITNLDGVHLELEYF